MPLEKKPKIKLGLYDGQDPSMSLEHFKALDKEIEAWFLGGPPPASE